MELVASLRQEKKSLEHHAGRLESEIASLKSEFAAREAELKNRFAARETELTAQISARDAELKTEIANRDLELKKLKSERQQLLSADDSTRFTDEDKEKLKARIHELVARINSHIG